MPVAGVPGGKSPFDADPRQSVLDNMVSGDVIVVVEDAEAVVGHRQIRHQSGEREQQTDKA